MALWPKNTTPAVSHDNSAQPIAGEPVAAGLQPDPAAPQASAQAAPLTPEQRKDAAMASKLLMAGFGEIVSVLVRAQDYRARPIAALEEIAIPAVLTGQFSLAQAQSSVNGMVAPVGVVFWARVSADIDQRLTQTIETEPVRLQLPEWRSGQIVWIVDAVGEQKVIEAMLSRLLETEWKGQEVRLRARTKDGSYKVGVLGRKGDTSSASAGN